VNDVFFAVHAATISTVTLTQVYCWGYSRSRQQVPSPWTAGFVVGAITAVLIMAVLVAASDGHIAEWIDVCYALSNIKLLCTFIKYVPQVSLTQREIRLTLIRPY